MQMTMEISMYPLQAEYRPLIKDFIERLNQEQDLDISTSHTATVVIGEYQRLMRLMTELMEWSCRTHGRAVFVTKFIPDYDPR